MYLITDLLIVNDCNRNVFLNNEVLREIYKVYWIQTLNISTAFTLGQYYSYNL